MMAAPSTRGAAIAAKCRDCIHDSEAAGTWRQQVTACPAIDCALWAFRPLAGGVPDFIASRDAAQIPPSWRSLPQDKAVAMLCGKASDLPHRLPAQPIQRAPASNGGGICQPRSDSPTDGTSGLSQYGAA
jgi:hypothetical protein